MTINLSDIPAATSAYIDNEVDVTVKNVTANLQPGEDGTFTVRVANAAAPTGVRLTDINLHVIMDPSRVAKVLPPGSALLLPRATASTSDPRLPTNVPVGEMFVFFLSDGPGVEPNSILDVGEAFEVEFEYRAVAVGDATIRCHVHASVAPEDLLPRSSGTNGTKPIRIHA